MNDGEQQAQTDRIRQFMEQQSTDQLLCIWTKGDETEWTPQAMDIARQTLESRVGALPESLRETIVGESSVGEAGEGEAEEPDTYHSLRTVVRIAQAAKAVGWVLLGLAALFILIDLVVLLGRLPPFDYQGARLAVVRSWLLPLLAAGFFCAVLQAVGEGLYVLLDIESNTRQPA